MPRLISCAAFALLAAFARLPDAGAAGNWPALGSSQDGVTLKVAPRSLSGAVWEFEVTFDTHTQALTDDLMKNAVLVAADGRRISPSGWQGDPPGGHHRTGMLRFDAITPAPAGFELRITRPGEPSPRSFRWTLQ